MRSKLFANIGSLSKLGSAFAPLSNWGASFPLTRWVMDRFMDVDRRRPLPAFVNRTFPRQFRGRSAAFDRAIQGHVVLFNDTFMNYNYPGIGMAATRLLERAGFTVSLVERKCCGRPMISKGMLDAAKANAQYNVDLLHPYVEQGAYVVGCEPSCLLTLRDEYPDLLRSPEADRVAEKSMLLEEFLHMLLREDRLNLRFRESPGRALYHAHCHSRSLVGTEPGDGGAESDSRAGRAGERGRLLRYGGRIRLREGTLRRVDDHRRAEAVPGRVRPGRGRTGGGYGHVLPAADTARHEPCAPRHLAEVLAEALD